ncbi:MAG TPA: HNH endonuclease signature motif containing protein [Mycobacteriales bacterium]|nr:HNH endonuclease signature motif containing protein [Mycobacteriales bacterium]
MSKPQRTIPGALRRAVYARDGGCTFPGCTRPAGWADIHHVIPWEQRNEHQIDNLMTVCGYHHRLVHLQKWQIDFINRIPHYTPPRWIDSDQKPIRNHFHRTAHNQPLRT